MHFIFFDITDHPGNLWMRLLYLGLVNFQEDLLQSNYFSPFKFYLFRGEY